ncbi:MAG TPA: non-homologous end-joining DNA ligase [Bryobacteraceae bacterium]|nr:non-homologous end-joining DNA ligase [Bryobacteraceae bacterium]
MSDAHGRFIAPMLLQPTTSLPENERWQYELKLDGYRAIAYKTRGKTHLRSRNNKDFSRKYPVITAALASMPDETVLDGEVVAIDESGKPSFNALQNYTAASIPLIYYVFDVMVLAGRDLIDERLSTRRELLQGDVLQRLEDPIRASAVLDARLADLIQAVKAQGLEGVVAKRKDSRYEPGQRSGAWQKMRVNLTREFVIGGYTRAPRAFDAVIFGCYDGARLIYVARTRSGFTPSSRKQLFKRFQGLETAHCPFVNLPEARAGRWGQGLTAEKMRDCVWVRPALVGQFEFLEATPDNHLRHAKFVALRECSAVDQVGAEGIEPSIY